LEGTPGKKEPEGGGGKSTAGKSVEGKSVGEKLADGKLGVKLADGKSVDENPSLISKSSCGMSQPIGPE
jgi:hypothetical protein